jgi:hypothetical protein
MSDSEDNKRGHADEAVVSLESAGVFSRGQIELLGEHWLRSCGEVISAAATDEGRAGLCRLLGVSAEELDRMVGELCAKLPSETVERFSTPAEQKAMGVIFEEAQEEDVNDDTDDNNDKGEKK